MISGFVTEKPNCSGGGGGDKPLPSAGKLGKEVEGGGIKASVLTFQFSDQVPGGSTHVPGGISAGYGSVGGTNTNSLLPSVA